MPLFIAQSEVRPTTEAKFLDVPFEASRRGGSSATVPMRERRGLNRRSNRYESSQISHPPTPAVRFCVTVAVTHALLLVRLDFCYPRRTPLCARRIACYPRRTPSCALQLPLPLPKGAATDKCFTLRAGRLAPRCARKAVMKLLHEKYLMRSLTGWFNYSLASRAKQAHGSLSGQNLLKG